MILQMARNNNRRKKDIKSKLIAAVCMLLVSTIMMVSSTYAWFTLSTAPEVKGITTSIGSNGALEIALSPASGKIDDVKDANLSTGDSWIAKNLTWGNMLDLGVMNDDGKTNYYGLDKLTLSPTMLLASGSDNAGTLGTTPLGTPIYGSDGRISGLSTDKTMIAGLNEGGTGYINGGAYGVRAVGSSSGMSAQQLGFRSNLSAISTNAENAAKAAGTSINANGSALASMVVQHARAGDSDTYDYKAYVPALQALTAELSSSVTYMQEAVRAALLVGASVEANETAYTVLVDSIKAAGWDDKQVTEGEESKTVKGIKTLVTEAQNESLSNIVKEIDRITSVIAGAKTNADALVTYNTSNPTEKITWDAQADKSLPGAGQVLTVLMNTSGDIKVNNYTLTELQGKMNDTDFLVGMVSDGITITLGNGSGVYYDIAKVAGNITATTNASVDSGTSLGTVTLKNVVIKTTVTEEAALISLKNALNTGITPAGNQGGAVLDTFYGYVIDLMFRTNAPASKLLLQTTAAQRIYGDSNNADTMGGGATLTFKDLSLSNANSVKGLVESIRIAFFDPANGKIYGIARATSTVSSEQADGKYTVVGNLKLCSYTIDATNGGRVTVGAVKTDSVADDNYNDGAVICDLDQNVAKAVSCLVYLDGEKVTNADVLYNTDVLGALNLQFASSVELEPIDNSDLFNGTEPSGGDETP